ncbi:MAG: hypothetical protein ACLR2O_07880 [Coprococcus sp.]
MEWQSDLNKFTETGRHGAGMLEKETRQLQRNLLKRKKTGRTTLDLVFRTMRGEFGNGEERKSWLGTRYGEVQDD